MLRGEKKLRFSECAYVQDHSSFSFKTCILYLVLAEDKRGLFSYTYNLILYTPGSPRMA